jgi:hypothetical protein
MEAKLSVNPASRFVRRLGDQLTTAWHAKVEDRIMRYCPFPAVAAALDGDTGPAEAYQRDVVPEIVRFGQAVQDHPAFQRVQGWGVRTGAALGIDKVVDRMFHP